MRRAERLHAVGANDDTVGVFSTGPGTATGDQGQRLISDIVDDRLRIDRTGHDLDFSDDVRSAVTVRTDILCENPNRGEREERGGSLGHDERGIVPDSVRKVPVSGPAVSN